LGPPFHGKGVGFSGPMTAEGMTPKVKRQRDENMEPNRQVDLTEEQKARVERNRQLALARRGERQAAATAAPSNTGNASVLGALTEQQLDKIRANREAALQRKRLREEKSMELNPEDVQKDGSERKEDKEESNVNKEMGCEKDVPQSSPAPVEEDMQGTFQEDLPEDAGCASDAPKRDEVMEDDSDEESSTTEMSSGSSSSSSEDNSTDTSSEGEESQDEFYEDAIEQKEVEDMEETEDMEEGDQDEQNKEIHEEDREKEEEVVDRRSLGPARAYNEPRCCTEQWPPVALKALPSGLEVPAPKVREHRSAKQSLVAKLLCRWWYVLPDWPPKDFDYTAALAEQGYRVVPVEDFESAAETEGDLRKVFALPNGYIGLYRDEQGSIIDVRPLEGRPSYDQLMLRSNAELHDLLLLAYQRQIEILESKVTVTSDSENVLQQLRQERMKAKNSLFKFGSKAAKDS